jgi:putative glutamine amidotransferase
VSGPPVIGVTGPARGGGAAWLMTAAAVVAAGGRPRHMIPGKVGDAGELDGLVLGGGADIDPALYREAEEGIADAYRASARASDAHPEAPSWRFWGPAVYLLRTALARGRRGPDPSRDELEQRLLATAITRDIPILGICRGAQLLNVHLGGTLYPEVREFYVEVPHLRTLLPRRRVSAERGSHLASIVGTTRLMVNALHHQAVKTLGKGLAVVARDEGGVIQAIEQPRHPFRIGVQWHPEYIPQHPRQRALFEALVRAARHPSGDRASA